MTAAAGVATLTVGIRNGTVGLAPLGHDLGAELVVVPLIDMAPSRVVAVWNEGDSNPLIRSFIEIASAAYRR